MADAIDWKNAEAPTLADFEVIASAVWERLASEFRDVCGDLVIRIEDFAIDEVLDELEIESPLDLLGLYHGLSLDKKSVSDLPREPDMVVLYRRAILDYWADGDETLGEIITHVLVHEIGHHFGFSDADMEQIEAQAVTG
jgi:predicted Zn-dependent protease with MMP-like domain